MVLVWVQTVCKGNQDVFIINFSKDSLRNAIGVSNGLDQDQDQRSLCPDLGPNCLQRLSVGLARLIEISVNRSIYKRKTIIDMKIQKSVIFNVCSVYLFN